MTSADKENKSVCRESKAVNLAALAKSSHIKKRESGRLKLPQTRAARCEEALKAWGQGLLSATRCVDRSIG